MTNQNPTRVVTGEVRLSYVNLLRPRETQSGALKFSTTLLIPKSDFATKQRIDAAIEAAKQIGQSKAWNGVIPPMVAIPLHDGDGVKPSDGMPFGDECKGHWVLSASSGADQAPKIVDLNLNPIIDPTEVYSGMFARVAINFSPYAQAGKKGVGCYLSTNVQKTRDGEPLGSSAPAAADDFGGGSQQQPMHNQQPQFQQQAPQQSYGQQQYQQMPTQQQYQQSTQQMYQQAPPINQAPSQQAYGQAPQQQIDPITGQPINGGVYGL